MKNKYERWPTETTSTTHPRTVLKGHPTSELTATENMANWRTVAEDALKNEPQYITIPHVHDKLKYLALRFSACHKCLQHLNKNRPLEGLHVYCV